MIGFYGGFIQIGIGILLIIGLYLFTGESLMVSNLNKLIIILIYTVPTTLYFAWLDQIVWLPAICLSAGQILGAFIAGYITSKIPRVEIWMRWFIVLMILITLVRLNLDKV
jgi:hypothetical protein